jgi:hypothetical protein
MPVSPAAANLLPGDSPATAPAVNNQIRIIAPGRTKFSLKTID